MTSDTAAAGFDSARLARIRPAMQRYVDSRGFCGISTMIARHGQVVHFEQVGWRDREADLPMTPDTLFRIYSMTKPIVCTALMLLFEEGRFHLYEPLATYLPAFGKAKVLRQHADGSVSEEPLARPILVRDVMTHTAGFTYGFLTDSPVSARYHEAEVVMRADTSLEAEIDRLAELPLAFQPGSRWHYSVGIDVAGRLIEVISGRSLRDFLRERIFGPLGMADTDFGVPADKLGSLAAMYGLPEVTAAARVTATVSARQDMSQSYPTDRPETFQRGGHGLFSTAPDYMRFAQMLLSGRSAAGERIIGRKTLELMHSNHLPARLLPFEIGGLPSLGYGFGLGSRVLLSPAETMMPGSVGEFGWSGAAKTYFWADPQEQLVGLFMTQSLSSPDTPERMFRQLVYQAMD